MNPSPTGRPADEAPLSPPAGAPSVPADSSYRIAEYSPGWPREFEREAARLREILGDALVAVHHVGSTSVPGLAAKPVIDMLPVARRLADVEERTPAMVQAGYRARGEYGLPRRRYFTLDRDGARACNIHVYQEGDPEIDRHLAFRDLLRADPDVRREYEALKREGYARHPDDVLAYCDHKDAWIKRMEAVALERFRAGWADPR